MAFNAMKKIVTILLLCLSVGLICRYIGFYYSNKWCVRESTVTLAKSDNLDYGVPCDCDILIDREGYSLGYDNVIRQARWVMYRLTREEVLSNEVKRTNIFNQDPLIVEWYSTSLDYLCSGYDRGHLAPAADMAWSKKAMEESFYMSNISPQKPEFNRGIWCDLETWVREVAKRETNIIVVTGPVVLPEDMTNTIGRNKVIVPTAFYKVIYDETPPEKMIGFVMANEGSRVSIKNYVFSVDDIEEITGLDFFNALEDEKEDILEKGCDFSTWER